MALQKRARKREEEVGGGRRAAAADCALLTSNVSVRPSAGTNVALFAVAFKLTKDREEEEVWNKLRHNAAQSHAAPLGPIVGSKRRCRAGKSNDGTISSQIVSALAAV